MLTILPYSASAGTTLSGCLCAMGLLPGIDIFRTVLYIFSLSKTKIGENNGTDAESGSSSSCG